MAGKSKEEATQGGEVWVQLATRIPKTLHKTLKMHCTANDTSVMRFCIEALEEKLAADTKGKKARYLRFYSNGSNASALNCYTEIEVWALPAK